MYFPVDDRLEDKAQQWVKSADQRLRAEGAKALRYFKSDANAALVKPLLEDPAFRLGSKFDKGKRERERIYEAREVAYTTLGRWGTDVAKPVLREMLPFRFEWQENESIKIADKEELNLAAGRIGRPRFSRDGGRQLGRKDGKQLGHEGVSSLCRL